MTLKFYRNEERNHNQLSELWGLSPFLLKALYQKCLRTKVCSQQPGFLSTQNHPDVPAPRRGGP